MKKFQDIFNAKILLFGEYLVIYNADALTVPYSFFNGHFSFIGENRYTRYDIAKNSARELRAYLDHYRRDPSLREEIPLDDRSFEKDLDGGLYFESNIPQAYGLGSSGALVAAIYKEYATEPVEFTGSDSLKRLKKIFSRLEAYFHGTSSGMDPLNCYVGSPLLFKSDGSISPAKMPAMQKEEFYIFLIDSGYPGNTQHLVNLFLRKNEDVEFNKRIIHEHIPLNNLCTEALVEGKSEIFFNTLKEYSRFQLLNYSEMVPSGLPDVWMKGLEENEYYLKLCGSGGGGVTLGFTRNYERTRLLMNNMNVRIMPVFEPGMTRQNK